jgi:RNA polymerase sigma-70 factor (ECF subfamily)
MYDRHVGDLFGLVYHLLGGDRGAAEDVNQEVWLLAIEQFDRFDPGRGEFRDWLLGIGRHRALRRHRCALGHAPSNRLDGPSDQLPPPEVLEEVERADVVRAALLCLREDYRRVLIDKYVAGLSVAEIADRIGRSAKAVESLLSRARGQLRDLLKPYFSTQTGGERHEPSDARPG